MEAAKHSGSPGKYKDCKSYNQGVTTRSDNTGKGLQTGLKAVKGSRKGKHRFDKDVGDNDLPGAATKRQLK